MYSDLGLYIDGKCIREMSSELRASASAGGAGMKNSFTAKPTKTSATIAVTLRARIVALPVES